MPLELPHRSHFDLAVDPRRALIALENASAEDRERVVRLVGSAGLRLETGIESSAPEGRAVDSRTIHLHQDLTLRVDGMEVDGDDFVLRQELRLKGAALGRSQRRKPPPLVAHSNRLTWVVGDHAVARATEALCSARFGSRVAVGPVYSFPGADQSLARRYAADPWIVDVRTKREGPDVELPSELEKYLRLRKDLPSVGHGWLRAELLHPMDIYEFAKLFIQAAGEHLFLSVRGLPMIVPLAGPVAVGEPSYPTQKPNLDLIKAQAMWNVAATTATSAVKVFYLDCGVFAPGGVDILVDQVLSVFIDQAIPGGFMPGCAPLSGDPHGTQVVGIAGGQWDLHGIAGVSGLRTNVTHVSLRCTTLGHVSDALGYAASVLGGAKGVVVVGLDVLQLYQDASNCAGLMAEAARFEAAMNTAQATNDLLIVIPSGNYDPTVSPPLSAIPRIPPNVSATLIVGAVDQAGLHRFSSPGLGIASRFGPGLSFVAPGENVYTTFNTTAAPAQYGFVWGTSFAAAHVAGVAALTRATFPALSAVAVKTKLMSCATALAGVTPDPETGMGLIDGSRAVV